MEGIFEAILQVFVEIVFGVIEEIVGETVELVASSDFWSYLNRKLSIIAPFSGEIKTLDILNLGKEDLR